LKAAGARAGNPIVIPTHTARSGTSSTPARGSTLRRRDRLGCPGHEISPGLFGGAARPTLIDAGPPLTAPEIPNGGPGWRS
jgi:hypothetical protein